EHDRGPVPVHFVRLPLADVVTHAVDDFHAECFRRLAEDFGERIPDPVGDELAVIPREIRSAAHRPPVVPPFSRVDRRAGQLEVGQLDFPSLHARFAHHDVVRGDLVAGPASCRVTFVMPPSPTPLGTFSKHASVKARRFGRTSGSRRLVRMRRTPQLMSYPIPPGEITPLL